MKRTWRKPKKKEIKKIFRSNENIRVNEIFLIDENEEKIGIMPIEEALRRAGEAELDLVEVNPTAEPPVVKILDYGQFKYEQEKKAHKNKVLQKKTETKSVRLSVRISQNDFDFKLNQAKGFLKKGNNLKLEIILRGREKSHPDKAKEMINRFVGALDEAEELNIVREQDLTRKGSGFNIILANKVA